MSSLRYVDFITTSATARRPSAIRALLPLLSLPGIISLAGGLPNPSTFPIESIALHLKDGTTLDISAEDTKLALQYGPTAGSIPLLAVLQELQRNVHQPHYTPTMCIGNGSQDLLSKAFHMLLDKGDPVLIESPCYAGTLAILRPMGVNMHPIETDEFGLIPEVLEKTLKEWPTTIKKPKVLYTVPTGGNPTGSVATLERKQKIYNLAKDHNLLILEDDPYYYLQLDYFNNRVPSYLSLDKDGRVLRFESFSKVFSAGVRLGMITGPDELVQRIILDVQATSLQPTGTSQMLLLTMFRHWNGLPGFFSHLHTVQQFYRQRRDTLHEIFKCHLNGLAEWTIPQAGLFMWLRIPAIRDTSTLISVYAREEKVLLLPGGEFIPGPGCAKDCQYVRATYSTATDEEMEEATKRFKKCILRAIEEQKGQ